MTQDLQDEIQEPEKAAEWLEMVQVAERYFEGWQGSAEKIERIYSSAANLTTDREFGLFWSNIQVMLPAIYARPPKPVVNSRFKDRRKLYGVASELLERCCDITFAQGGMDETMLAIRDDLAIIGRGAAWVRYHSDEKADKICYEYVDRQDFLHDPARRWVDVSWVARRGWMTHKELRKRFSRSVADDAVFTRKPGDSFRTSDASDFMARAGVWEIWHKPSNCVVWVVEGCEDVLEKSAPPVKLEGFFPCPKPAYATLESRTLIPVPDIRYYQDQLIQINELTSRIASLSQWLQYKGLYAAGGSVGEAVEHALDMHNSDKVLVPIPSMADLGPSGAPVWMFPIEQLAATLTACVELRRQLIEDVYQIIGLSDIMRGQTQADETLGAQRIKQQNGSSRVRDKQAELERVARDMLRIGAEIMCEEFSRKDLQEMAQMDLPTNKEIKKRVDDLVKQAGDMAEAANAQAEELMAQPAETPEAEQQKQQQLQQMQEQQQQQISEQQKQLAEITDTVTIDQVMDFLGDEKLRPFALEIETDSTIYPDEIMEKSQRAEFMQAFTQAIGIIPMAAQAGPEAVALAGKVLQFALAPYRVGRELEGMIDDMVDAAPQIVERQQAQQGSGESDEMAKANLELAKAEMVKAEAAVAKVQADTQGKMQEIQLKAAEAQSTAQANQQKFMLEMEKTKSTIQETEARTQKVFAEIQKLAVDAENQTRAADRDDLKTVVDIEARQVDQAMAMSGQASQDERANRAEQRADRGEDRADRQQDFAERGEGDE